MPDVQPTSVPSRTGLWSRGLACRATAWPSGVGQIEIARQVVCVYKGGPGGETGKRRQPMTGIQGGWADEPSRVMLLACC